MSIASHDATFPLPTRRGGHALQPWIELAGRLLLGVLFLFSGLGKIAGYAATAGYMSAMGVPTVLLPMVIVLEVLGALLLFIGWKARSVAFLLAGFSLVSAAIFHANFADQIQLVMFLKNVSIAGGLLLVVANGPGPYSIDGKQPSKAA